MHDGELFFRLDPLEVSYRGIWAWVFIKNQPPLENCGFASLFAGGAVQMGSLSYAAGNRFAVFYLQREVRLRGF